MATYAQLEAEPWWRAEKMSPTMQVLAEKLRAFYGVGPANIGSKGDNAPGHMQGAHRSRAWIQNSRYCTNRIYTVSETQGNRTGGDSNWLAGMDITVPSAQLIPMCARLDAAVRSGTLEKVTEWYGNDDGDNRVDGYNNIRNQVASSDLSHLWHLHITFDRGRAGEDHADLYAVLTGTGTPPPPQEVLMAQMHLFADNAGTLFFCPGYHTPRGRLALYPVPNNDYAAIKPYDDTASIPTINYKGSGYSAKDLPWYDLDPQPWPAGGGGSGLSYDEAVQAAKEGANLAEDS